MNREETRAAAEVMLHFADGWEVEYRSLFLDSSWKPVCGDPMWNWRDHDYRKAQPKVSRYRRYVVETIGHTGERIRKVCLLDEDCVGLVRRTPDECVTEFCTNFVDWIDREWQEAT